MRGNGHRHPLKLLVLLTATGTASGDLDDAAGPAASLAPATSWSAVVGSLASDTPPAAFVAAGERLDDEGRRTVGALHRRGLLVPTGVYLGTLTPEVVERIYPLHRFGVRLLFPGKDLGERLRDLLGASPQRVASYLVRRLGIRDGATIGLLRLLADGDERRRRSPSDLATRIHVSRTRLYQLVRDVGLPSVEHCQYLFRLLPACLLISRGGSAEDAAYLAGLSDAAALRKSLRSRLGTSISEIRAGADAMLIAERWLELHTDPTPRGTAATPRANGSDAAGNGSG